MGKGEFEKIWKDAFEDAKAEPSDNLWIGIEAGIANAEAARFRRGMAFYKWVAAAGVVLIAGLLGYQALEPKPRFEIAEDRLQIDRQESITPDRESTITSKGNRVEQTRAGEDAAKNSSVTSKGNSVEQTEAVDVRTKDNSATNRGNKVEQTGAGEDTMKDQLFSSISIGQLELLTGQAPAEIGSLELSEAPDEVNGVIVYPVKESSKGAGLWAGLNMTPGYFDPNYQTSGGSRSNSVVIPGNAYLNSATANESHSSGLSMSFGMEMGMRISERWQLSSGLQYLDNNVRSSTNLVLANKTPVFSSTIESLDFSGSNTTSDISFEPTELDNTFQFLSVPVQAGYLVVDKKVKLLLNAGIASDFFLKNRISSVDQSLESVTINPGSDAPFKSVYFNGLLGAQASYEFLPRYLVSLEPRYKLAISDFTRSTTSYASFPSSFGIGVGVKYVFK